MKNWQSRTELLLGTSCIKKISQMQVLIIGLGGVGGYVAEMLTRAGIGSLVLADGDKISLSNINRQIIAMHSTLDISKAEVFQRRLLDINPDLNIEVVDNFLEDKDISMILDSHQYDYVVDAIDSLAPKISLIQQSLKRNLKLISSMGSGGKTDPSQVFVADINDTYSCKLARIVRKRLHREGIFTGFKTVFSPEIVNPESILLVEERNKKSTLGTISYMPAIFGCFCAAEVLRDLISISG